MTGEGVDEYAHRTVETASVLDEEVAFVASNDRIRNRVGQVSRERHVLEELVSVARPDDVVWDVGACLGIHSLLTAAHLHDGSVVSFEPMPSNRGALVDTRSVNDAEQVRVRREALADEPGERSFAIRESNEPGYGRHSFDVGDYDALRTIDVPVATGDGLVERGAVPAPNVVKIDVEGAGPLVLEGMTDVLSRPSCHAVVLETHEPNPVQPSHEDFGYDVADVEALLSSFGFEVDRLVKEYHLVGRKGETGTLDLDDASLDVTVEAGDIAEVAADAVVCSAGTSLRMGTGVAGALRAAGGEALNREAMAEGPVPVGGVAVTDAHDLDAAVVVHAASMPHHGDGQSTPASIRESVRGALQAADERGCETVAVPAVGCGLGGVPLVTGAEVVLEELLAFEPDSLRRARFVLYTDEQREAVDLLL
jgi:FkbM family methyltransferase